MTRLGYTLLMMAIVSRAGAGAPLEPARGVLFGAFVDPAEYSPLSFNATMRVDHAFFTRFDAWPVDYSALDQFFRQVAGVRAAVLLTIEPFTGLTALTTAALGEFASNVYGLVRQHDVPCFLRFAHEMNGSWYPWCMQPVAYSQAFAQLAAVVHGLTTDRMAMVWAPNNSDGYPFWPYLNVDVQQYLTNTPYHGTAEDFARLDTNGNGLLDANDDPYLPFYPGDEAVDWVGITIYHWDNEYPFDTNEVPYAQKVTKILTGHGNVLRNFYQRFAAGKNKPLMIPETSAMYCESFGGASEYAIKMAYMDQLYHSGTDTANALSLPVHFPLLKAIGWFNIRKYEGELQAIVDWRVSHRTDLRTNYTAQAHAVVNGQRFGVTALDMRGIVYGWNGWLQGWRAVDPGCSIALSTPGYEGTNALRLTYDGTGNKAEVNIAVDDQALYDGPWSAGRYLRAQVRVNGSRGVQLRPVLQSSQTGWDPLPIATVPADDAWHTVTWEYHWNRHVSATWFNVYWAVPLGHVTNRVDVSVDAVEIFVPEGSGALAGGFAIWTWWRAGRLRAR